MSSTDETPAQSPAADRMAAARAVRAANLAAARAADAPESPQDADPDEAPPATPEAREAGPTTMENVAIKEQSAREAKIEALRKAKLGAATSVGEPLVQVRVLKRGAGLISMGEHISGLGELTYDANETPDLPRSVAQALEDKGLVEIQ